MELVWQCQSVRTFSTCFALCTQTFEFRPMSWPLVWGGCEYLRLNRFGRFVFLCFTAVSPVISFVFHLFASDCLCPSVQPSVSQSVRLPVLQHKRSVNTRFAHGAQGLEHRSGHYSYGSTLQSRLIFVLRYAHSARLQDDRSRDDHHFSQGAHPQRRHSSHPD